ncbi:haloacid dehalogenase-like hydrolase domain-containing protein 3 [Halichondria panicea]|uniref:haloacid dehalogenase-like hydrolase domain-containing protein 3 n=1 Tax=Halichondria panicea TaxID=6063 RepID=UPI00312B815A
MARLVTLDITNTCIRIATSPGFHYAKIGREFDLNLDPQQLDSAFRKSFKAHNLSHPCFGAQQGLTSRDWWRMVTTELFVQVGVDSNELNEKLATRVFDDFAGPANWEVFPDVEPSLKKIKQAGIVLGVISNFDERLESIITALGIRQYFDFIIASVYTKCAKPNPRIFEMALQECSGIEANASVHVGDDYELDYLAAKNFGMKSLLLVREGTSKENIPRDTPTVSSLTEVCSHLRL